MEPNKKLKILITTDLYTTNTNGVVTSVQNLFDELTAKGHDVRILTLSDSIHSIGDHAFDGCSSLLHVALPHFLTSIESNTFSNCTLLSTVTIPRSVRGIAPTAFRNCPELTIFAGYGSRAEAYCHQHKIPFIEEA